jgi:hypothetical protein
MAEKNRVAESGANAGLDGGRGLAGSGSRPKPSAVMLEDHRSGAGSRTREELETVVRFDRSGPGAQLWTSDLLQARRWLARGYPVEPVAGGWRCTVPKRALTFRVLTASLLASLAGPEDGEGLEGDIEAAVTSTTAGEEGERYHRDAHLEALDDFDEVARMMAEEEAGS